MAVIGMPHTGKTHTIFINSNREKILTRVLSAILIEEQHLSKKWDLRRM